MKLKSTYIENFGKLSRTNFHFDERLTIIYGKNEAGKSTFHSYLKAMLFGQERKRGRAAKTDEYSRFLPWNQEGEYGGSLRFESQGHSYLLHRIFQPERRVLELSDETAKKTLEGTEDVLKSLIGDLSPSLYENTLSIGQLKCATGQPLADALKNHAGSFQKTGSSQIRLETAALSVKQQKKKLEQALYPVKEAERDALKEELFQMEQRSASGSNRQKSEELKAERDCLIKNVQAQTSRYKRLEQLLGRSRQVLDASPFSDEEEVLIFQKRLENAWNTRKNHFPYVQGFFSFHRTVSFLSELCYYGMLVFFLGAELFLLKRSWSPCIILSVLAFLSYMVSSYLSVRRENFHTFCQAESFLEEAFLSNLKDRSVTEANYKALQERLGSTVRLFKQTRILEGQLSPLADEIFRSQDILARSEEKLHSLQKSLWDEEQEQKKRNERYDQLEDMERKLLENTKIKEDIAACEKALQVFDRISQQLQETFGGPLNETASRILAEITHEKYDSLLYDQNGNLFVTEGFRKIPLDYVSRGTIDQVYLALRLSAVKIFWPDQDMPLIFDDIFALYDEDRLRSTLFYLAHHYPGQILIFTCHEREARLCRELALPHTVIALS